MKTPSPTPPPHPAVLDGWEGTVKTSHSGTGLRNQGPSLGGTPTSQGARAEFLERPAPRGNHGSGVTELHGGFKGNEI